MTKEIPYTPDSGRSLLELLTVMAIIGLFTAGGVKTYDTLTAKTKAQNTAKMISTMAIEHQSPLYNNKRPAGEYSVKGPHGQLYLKEGTAGNQSQFFRIETKVSGSAFCAELKDSELIHSKLVTLNGQIDGECTNTNLLSFYFDKNPDHSGSLTYTDSEGKKHLCPANANCNTTGFMGCADGYYLNQNECLECPEHSECHSETGFTCLAGYYKSENKCLKCENRQISSAGEDSCEICPAATTNNATYTECVNCQTGETCGCGGSAPYADGEGHCVECTQTDHCPNEAPYCNAAGICYCPENADCSATQTPFSCLAGYYKEEDSCIQCGTRQISSAGTNVCSECPAGKTNNSLHTQCIDCPAGENCGCFGDAPYANGAGGCVACVSNTHCNENESCIQGQCVSGLRCLGQISQCHNQMGVQINGQLYCYNTDSELLGRCIEAVPGKTNCESGRTGEECYLATNSSGEDVAGNCNWGYFSQNEAKNFCSGLGGRLLTKDEIMSVWSDFALCNPPMGKNGTCYWTSTYSGAGGFYWCRSDLGIGSTRKDGYSNAGGALCKM